MDRNRPYDEEQCTAELASILEESPRVRLLLSNVFKLNKKALVKGVTCRKCEGTLQHNKFGYYDPQYKRLRSKRALEETLIHELVHAFDASRKGKFTSPCHLVACGEVRASKLGQCAHVWPSFRKRDCVFRDAVNSTQPHCRDASKVVAEVFENCYKDSAPFPSVDEK
ncbi:peptidase M76 [Endogone sp. FLAS-F59071]|nr:peptidase M76 [Endogone sp. FLAS-F59071]|eukprot:RUS20497.1 peptidase M76 [Endogone sp. FLAS-F59071]